jgi:hypothetical protein
MLVGAAYFLARADGCTEFVDGRLRSNLLYLHVLLLSISNTFRPTLLSFSRLGRQPWKQ